MIIFSKKLYYILFLIIFSIIFNQYYGYIGILPIDSFLIFNSGFDLMNGHFPFKDYWTIKEPFIDLIQALFFYVFGVSWSVYVFHASVFNCIITLATFLILKEFKLNINLSFFYSFCVAILFYPTVGTPFSDHHTLIFCIISFYLFILALKKDKKIYWFLTPLFLGFGVMSKQAPSLYFIILISILSVFYLLYSKNFKNFIYSIYGFFATIIFFLGLFLIAKINFIDVFYQYYLYPSSLGETRLDWLLPIEFKRFIWRFKIFYISIAVLIYILIIQLIKKNHALVDNLIMLGVISICLISICHQLMTINAIFIYCLIPIFCGFSHIYSEKYLNNKFVNIFLILLTLGSTVYYFTKYVNSRTFMDLKNVDFNKSIDGSNINEKLKNVKWITMFYPENPEEEAENIKLFVDTLKKDSENKMIVTDYQFISVFLNQYDFSVTRFWYDFHGYPQKNNEYFLYWKNFVLKQIKKNKIKNIYVLLPLHGENKPLENVLENCFEKQTFSEVFYKLKLSNC
jgi:hypothetical protein|tara:strand:+ start:2660 stop:4198 length:1539 start_codon:yes stop_codon:yes gene_type:complete